MAFVLVVPVLWYAAPISVALLVLREQAYGNPTSITLFSFRIGPLWGNKNQFLSP